MSNNSSVSTKTGVGLLDLLVLTSVILGVLKVAGVLSLTWTQVFIPIFVALGISVLFIVILILLLLLAAVLRR